jgi:hypothetical protein
VLLTHFNIRRRNDLYEHYISTCCRLTLLCKHFIAGFLAIFIINFSANAEEVELRYSFAGDIFSELTGNSLRRNNKICFPLNSGQSSSAISLPAETVINIDQISIIDSESSQYISIKATVSDPLDSFGITSTLISIQDSQGNIRINQQNMSLLTDSGVATKTFFYAYSLPNDTAIGTILTYTINSTLNFVSSLNS